MNLDKHTVIGGVDRPKGKNKEPEFLVSSEIRFLT